MVASGGARARKAGAKAAAGRAPGSATNGKETESGPRRSVVFWPSLAAAVAAGAAAAWALRRPGARPAPLPAEPTVYTYRVVRTYRHDPAAFTQGLLWANGSLYESTGLYGRSSVRELRLHEGEAPTPGSLEELRRAELGPRHFGEGLVHRRGELLQLLWRTGEGLRYAARAGSGGRLDPLPARAFRTPLQDGWGLADGGEALLATDSGADVFFLDPETLALRRALRVADAGRAVEMLNELEVVDGELWANVFGQDCIARVDLGTGRVSGWVVLTGLLDWANARRAAKRKGREMPDVMNGIAWDASSRRLFVTGKLWPLLFEIEVLPSTNVSLDEARRRCIPERNIFRPSARGAGA